MNEDTDPYDLGKQFERLKRFGLANVRWITRTAIVLLAGLLILHAVHPPSVEWVGERLHLAPPSLAAILSLAVLVWVLERILVLQARVDRPPVSVHAPRTQAYNMLSELLGQRRVRVADLLQVSGQTAVRFLRDLAESHPNASVRLLLMHPKVAESFDSDNDPNHRDRILTTVREVGLIQKDYPGFRIQQKFYETPPGVSAIVVDRAVISISWYHCFKDPDHPGVTRVRGHLAPTLTASGEHAQSLISFASEQFEQVWKTAEETYE